MSEPGVNYESTKRLKNNRNSKVTSNKNDFQFQARFFFHQILQPLITAKIPSVQCFPLSKAHRIYLVDSKVWIPSKSLGPLSLPNRNMLESFELVKYSLLQIDNGKIRASAMTWTFKIFRNLGEREQMTRLNTRPGSLPQCALLHNGQDEKSQQCGTTRLTLSTHITDHILQPLWNP